MSLWQNYLFYKKNLFLFGIKILDTNKKYDIWNSPVEVEQDPPQNLSHQKLNQQLISWFICSKVVVNTQFSV